MTNLRLGAALPLGAAALVLLFAAPASAHHLIHLFQLTPSPLTGLVSGLAHPLFGPDHLLFLLALGLVGLQKRLSWVLGLLATGLAGSCLGLALPGIPLAEPLVALSLVVVGLVLLDRLPALLLVPAFALHGYVLSAAVIGWEQSPIAFYLVGLLVSQGLLLTTSLTLVRRWGTGLSASQLRLTAGILIGVGSSFAWSALVP
jgi:urease accessory protein